MESKCPPNESSPKPKSPYKDRSPNDTSPMPNASAADVEDYFELAYETDEFGLHVPEFLTAR